MYKSIEPLIPNTICEANEVNGDVLCYSIRPANGYKLHAISFDEPIFDEKTREETNQIKLGYTAEGFATVFKDYDWEKNPDQIYAVPIDAEEEIIEKEDTSSELAEKAKAYDILMGADTDESY